MFTPIGYFAPQGANLIPVTGYSVYIDFKDSPMTLNGGNIAEIQDLSGNGYHAIQTSSVHQPYWNPDGYWDGQETTNSYFLDWSSANPLLLNRPPNVNDWSFALGINESSHRRQPLGLGTGRTAGQSDAWIVQTFMNDSPGRRDLQISRRQVPGFSTNDVTKGLIVFGNTQSSILEWYLRKSTESYYYDTFTNWATEPAGSTSRIGHTAQLNATMNDGWKGKIYFIAYWPRLLTTQERSDIADWAVNKWGLTLT